MLESNYYRNRSFFKSRRKNLPKSGDRQRYITYCARGYSNTHNSTFIRVGGRNKPKGIVDRHFCESVKSWETAACIVESRKRWEEWRKRDRISRLIWDYGATRRDIGLAIPRVQNLLERCEERQKANCSASSSTVPAPFSREFPLLFVTNHATNISPFFLQ